MVPLGLAVFSSGIDLNWIFYSGATVTIPCFPPVVLSIIWVKATGKGLIAGRYIMVVLRLVMWSLDQIKFKAFSVFAEAYRKVIFTS